MASNLTSKQIITWKNEIDKVIRTDLITSLKKSNESALQLQKITASATSDEDNLSYRFRDLAQVTTEATKQLTTFITVFDENLDLYIKTVKDAEQVAAEKVLKKIDQFAEAAQKIAKLSIN